MFCRIFDRSYSYSLSLALVFAVFLLMITIAAAQQSPILTVTPDPTEVVPGAPVTFTMSYDFPADYEVALPVEIVVTWNNATFVEATGAPELDTGGTQATWTYEAGLPDPAALPIITLTAGAAPGPIDVTATISSAAQASETLRSIEGTATVDILDASPEVATDIPPQADLSTSTLVLDPSDTIVAGSPISITVIVSNTGSTAAEDVTVVFTPTSQIDDLTLIELLAGTLRGPTETGVFTISLRDVLPQDDSMTVNLKGIVASDVEEELGITALFTATGAISESLNVSVPVVPPARPTLAVEIDGPASAMIGEALSLVLRVSNTGADAVENVKVEVTTSPAINLEVVDGGLVTSTQSGNNRLLLEIPSIASSDVAEVTLTGVAPDSSAPLLVDVTIQDSELFDSQSTLAKRLAIPLTFPPPIATPEPVVTEPPSTAEPVASLTPTPEVAPSGTSQPPEDGARILLFIGSVALLAAIVAGIVLYFLISGRSAGPTNASASGSPLSPQTPQLPGQQVVFDSGPDAVNILGAAYAVIPVGTVLEGRYRVLSSLGTGGFGAVYLAEDLRLSGKRVAVKETLDSTPAGLSQFQREAAMLATLAHENLPRVTDYFSESASRHFLVMDFIDGEDLQAMVDRLGPLQSIDIHRWMLQVLDALAYLHEQPQPVIHRDIKPANIRITADGRSGNLRKDRAVLVDFGIAKIYLADTQTTVGARAVTPGYSPPEQYGVGRTDPRSDIYALGATAYKLLTGVTPMQSVERLAGLPLTHLRQINGSVSVEWESVVLTAMELDVRNRYQSAEAMRLALSSIPGAGQAGGAAAGTTTCPDCGVENRSVARFCKVCGTPLHTDP